MQYLIENTTVTVFIQKIDYGITVIFEKINGNTVIQSLVRPPKNRVFRLIKPNVHGGLDIFIAWFNR